MQPLILILATVHFESVLPRWAFEALHVGSRVPVVRLLYLVVRLDSAPSREFWRNAREQIKLPRATAAAPDAEKLLGEASWVRLCPRLFVVVRLNRCRTDPVRSSQGDSMLHTAVSMCVCV